MAERERKKALPKEVGGWRCGCCRGWLLLLAAPAVVVGAALVLSLSRLRACMQRGQHMPPL
jgi:hypothetical protein